MVKIPPWCTAGRASSRLSVLQCRWCAELFYIVVVKRPFAVCTGFCRKSQKYQLCQGCGSSRYDRELPTFCSGKVRNDFRSMYFQAITGSIVIVCSLFTVLKFMVCMNTNNEASEC